MPTSPEIGHDFRATPHKQGVGGQRAGVSPRPPGWPPTEERGRGPSHPCSDSRPELSDGIPGSAPGPLLVLASRGPFLFLLPLSACPSGPTRLPGPASWRSAPGNITLVLRIRNDKIVQLINSGEYPNLIAVAIRIWTWGYLFHAHRRYDGFDDGVENSGAAQRTDDASGEGQSRPANQLTGCWARSSWTQALRARSSSPKIFRKSFLLVILRCGACCLEACVQPLSSLSVPPAKKPAASLPKVFSPS